MYPLVVQPDAGESTQTPRVRAPTTPTTPPARGTPGAPHVSRFWIPPSASLALGRSSDINAHFATPSWRSSKKDQRPHPWDDAPPPMPVSCRFARAQFVGVHHFLQTRGVEKLGACMVGRDAKGRKHQASGCGDHRQLSNFMHIAVLGGANARCSLARGMPNTFNHTNCTRDQV